MTSKERKTYSSVEELFEDLENDPSIKWTIFDEIRYFFLDKLPSMWYNIKNGIKQVVKWLPIIWKEQDWDYIYLYGIIKNKLEFMVAEFECCDFKAKENDVKWMRSAIKLLDRIINEEYLVANWSENKSPAHHFVEEALAAKKHKRLLFNILLKKGDNWWI